VIGKWFGLICRLEACLARLRRRLHWIELMKKREESKNDLEPVLIPKSGPFQNHSAPSPLPAPYLSLVISSKVVWTYTVVSNKPLKIPHQWDAHQRDYGQQGPPSHHCTAPPPNQETPPSQRIGIRNRGWNRRFNASEGSTMWDKVALLRCWETSNCRIHHVLHHRLSILGNRPNKASTVRFSHSISSRTEYILYSVVYTWALF
jgi:hypothetical protein